MIAVSWLHYELNFLVLVDLVRDSIDEARCPVGMECHITVIIVHTLHGISTLVVMDGKLKFDAGR